MTLIYSNKKLKIFGLSKANRWVFLTLAHTDLRKGKGWKIKETITTISRFSSFLGKKQHYNYTSSRWISFWQQIYWGEILRSNHIRQYISNSCSCKWRCNNHVCTLPFFLITSFEEIWTRAEKIQQVASVIYSLFNFCINMA